MSEASEKAQTDDPNLVEEEDGYITIMARLKAWWNGTEVEVKRVPKKSADKGGARRSLLMEMDDKEPEVQRRWEKARIEINERLWGKGFNWPGGATYMVNFVKPLALNKEMTVIDLACGFGGGTVEVAIKFGLWTAGVERDEELIDVAKGTCVANDMEKRVQVKHYDPSSFQMPDMKFHRIFMRETMYSYPDKMYVLETIKKALRPNGEMLFTDFVLADRSAEHKDVTKWKDGEDFAVRMWTPEDYQKAFQKLKMDVRVMQDITDEYKTMVMQGWSKLMRDMKKDDLTIDFVNALIEEGEYWQRRLKAIESGQLRLMRIHVILPKMRAMTEGMKRTET